MWENPLVKRKTEIVTATTEIEKTISPFSSTEKTPNLLHKNIIGPTKQNSGKSFEINLLTFFHFLKNNFLIYLKT